MARFVVFVGVHGEVAVNPEHVLYAAPLPDTGDCWLYFGGKGAGEEGAPAVIVVQVKGALKDVVAAPERSADEDRRGDGRGDNATSATTPQPEEPILLPAPGDV